MNNLIYATLLYDLATATLEVHRYNQRITATRL